MSLQKMQDCGVHAQNNLLIHGGKAEPCNQRSAEAKIRTIDTEEYSKVFGKLKRKHAPWKGTGCCGAIPEGFASRHLKHLLIRGLWANQTPKSRGLIIISE